MGPTVWELDGPIPTLKSSKTLTVTLLDLRVRLRLECGSDHLDG
jgi:hypothetical protein